MTGRVMFGRPDGRFVARVALPGRSTTEDDLSAYALHEQQVLFVPRARGSAVVAPGVSLQVLDEPALIGRFPFVLLASDEGILPVSYYPALDGSQVELGTYQMVINPATGVCWITNYYATSLTIRFAIFSAL